MIFSWAPKQLAGIENKQLDKQLKTLKLVRQLAHRQIFDYREFVKAEILTVINRIPITDELSKFQTLFLSV